MISWGNPELLSVSLLPRTGRQTSCRFVSCLPGLWLACGFPFCDGMSLDILAKRSLNKVGNCCSRRCFVCV